MTIQNPYKVILTIVIGLLFIYVASGSTAFIYIPFVIGGIALISTNTASYIVKAWMKLAHVLSFVFPPILLGLIYLLFLTPIAFLSRFFRKETNLNLKNTSSSQFKVVNKRFEPNSFEKMW